VEAAANATSPISRLQVRARRVMPHCSDGPGAATWTGGQKKGPLLAGLCQSPGSPALCGVTANSGNRLSSYRARRVPPKEPVFCVNWIDHIGEFSTSVPTVGKTEPTIRRSKNLAHCAFGILQGEPELLRELIDGRS
jgi:hypothetical protein